MGNLFGIRRRAPVVTAQDKAVLQLKQQRDRIKIYQKKTEIDLAKSKELALMLFQAGKKDRAIVIMRRKKNMEDILSRTDKQLETLEQLVSDIEYTQIEVSVVEGLKVGTEALKQMNSLMDIDDIQKMMEDNEEAAAKQREISEILQKSSERYDEEDLLRELDSYTSDKPKESVQSIEPVDIPDELPTVPEGEPQLEVQPPEEPIDEQQKSKTPNKSKAERVKVQES